MSDYGWIETITQLVGTALVGLVSYFVWCLYNARMEFYKLKKQGLPMPPWNPILGHLLILPKYLAQVPKGSQQSYMFGILSQLFPDSDGTYYIDLWPFSGPKIMTVSPQVARQVCQELDLGKPAMIYPFFKPITGGHGIFTQNGAEWKASRELFNPAFNASEILHHTPRIVEHAQEFVGKLREHAKKGDVFSLDRLTCWYMMDVIGSVALDARLNCLRGSPNVLAASMRNALDNHMRDEELNPFKRYSPMRPIREWNNSYKMDTYISAELDKKYQKWRTSSSPSKTKSIMDLAMADYMRGRTASQNLDTSFKTWACAQIRLFLFVGHDSTAAIIVYALYLLSKNPEALARIREEHSKVFGANPTVAPELLLSKHHLINQLPYTTAVIKETLRLFPPAYGFRGAEPGSPITLRNPQAPAERWPIHDFGIWILHDYIGRHPEYWVSRHEFLPERWLVEPGHELYPRDRDAWRPFEYGSRNCVGQTLVMLDIKITLLMIVREFDVRDAYEEWDGVMGRRSGMQTFYDGERAFQVSKGSGHPVDGFPCRVEVRRADGGA